MSVIQTHWRSYTVFIIPDFHYSVYRIYISIIYSDICYSVHGHVIKLLVPRKNFTKRPLSVNVYEQSMFTGSIVLI